MSCNWLLRFFLTQLWMKSTRIKPVKLFGLSITRKKGKEIEVTKNRTLIKK